MQSSSTIALLDRRKTQRCFANLYRKRLPSFKTACSSQGEESTLERIQIHVLFVRVTRRSLDDGTAGVQDEPLQGINVSRSISHVGVASFETRIDEIWSSRAQSACVADGACTVSENLNSSALRHDSKLEIVVCRVLTSECVLALST